MDGIRPCAYSHVQRSAIRASDTVEKSELELRYKSWVKANIACQLGDFEAAMVLLKVARENGCNELFLWETYGNVLLKPMLDYPPFKEFMKPKG